MAGSFLQSLSPQIKQYLVITGNYWAFTLTDGALRMLVVLYFHQLGYSPLNIAMLFLFYEIFGVVTNLVGGWLGARAWFEQNHEHRFSAANYCTFHANSFGRDADCCLCDGSASVIWYC